MTLSARAIDGVINRFLRLGPEGRRADIGLGRDRSELIMSGAAILQTLLAALADRTRCASPTAGCARGCCSR